MLVPYRTKSPIEKYEPKKYGLIKKTGRNPWRVFIDFASLFVDIFQGIKDVCTRHRCDYPGWHTRVWHAIKGEPFDDDSYYRCLCGKVWEFERRTGKWTSYSYGLKEWVERGGEE